mmetsp:Transcript_43303/g.113943  ORF Transcript_43303/g.113943 Transcript_43303/m.113943 type:complete len:166 (-) Transcript_43303:394-891(-)
MSCFGPRRGSCTDVLVSEGVHELQVRRRSCGQMLPEDAVTIPIDSLTRVPVDLYERLLKEGQRDRGQHRLIRSPRRTQHLVRSRPVSACVEHDFPIQEMYRCRSDRAVHASSYVSCGFGSCARSKSATQLRTGTSGMDDGRRNSDVGPRGWRSLLTSWTETLTRG